MYDCMGLHTGSSFTLPETGAYQTDGVNSCTANWTPTRPSATPTPTTVRGDSTRKHWHVDMHGEDRRTHTRTHARTGRAYCCSDGGPDAGTHPGDECNMHTCPAVTWFTTSSHALS
jgi:hypothetical protein